MGNQLCQECCYLQKNIDIYDRDDNALKQYMHNINKQQSLTLKQSEIFLNQDHMQIESTTPLHPYINNFSDQNLYKVNIPLNDSTHLSNLSETHTKTHQKTDLYQISHSRAKQSQIMLPDGSVFKGQTIHDIPNGHGVQQHICGDHYDGHFKNGLKHGYGVYFYNGQGTYRGNFVNGQMDGYGQFQWQNGDAYKGQFKDNQKHGFGKYYCKQGHYEGLYQKGQRCGQGKAKCKHHQIEGIWKDNKILIDHVLVPYSCAKN